MELTPNQTTVLLGILSNGITIVLSYGSRLTAGGIMRSALVRKLRDPRSPVQKKLAQAIANFTALDPVVGDIPSDQLDLFLQSPELEALVRQLYSVQLTTDNPEVPLRRLRSQLNIYFQLFFELPEQRAQPWSDTFFDAIVKLSNTVLDAAIDDGMLAAHEAKSALRHNILLEQVESISDNLRFLAEGPNIALESINSFAREYIELVSIRYGYIIPPFYHETRKVPLPDIYVEQAFSEHHPRSKGQRSRLSLSQLRDATNRSVVLGDPGGGKSTLIQKLAFDLSSRSDTSKAQCHGAVPLAVIVRKYNGQKSDNHGSVIDYIESTIRADYHLTPPQGAVEYLLRSGRAFLLFDGLDELLDTGTRQDMTTNVEVIASRFPNTPILVTSRTIGYNLAPLASDRFQCYYLDSLSDRQVDIYVRKWFSLDNSAPDTGLPDRLSTAFLRESESVSDLRNNPLMLSLMCNLYKGELYIPQNLPEVYAACANMLFKNWDKLKEIKSAPAYEAMLEPSLAHIAHWIYGNADLEEDGVPERELLKKLVSYLWPEQFSSRADAEVAAADLVSFSQGRAWVFTDTGTNQAGQGLYQFTHRSFLEYFTALYLADMSEDPESLVRGRIESIAAGEHDLVNQLSVQIKGGAGLRSRDRLLGQLMEELAQRNGLQTWNALYFGIRTLEFLSPSSSILRGLWSLCVDLVGEERRTAGGRLSVDSSLTSADGLNGSRCLAAFWRAREENRSRMPGEIESWWPNFASEGSIDRGRFVIDTIMALPNIARTDLTSSNARYRLNAEYWCELFVRFANSTPRRDEFLQCSTDVASWLFLMDKVDLDVLLSRWGTAALFRRIRSESWGVQVGVAPILVLLRVSLDLSNSYPCPTSRSAAQRDLSRLGRLLLRAGTPILPIRSTSVVTMKELAESCPVENLLALDIAEPGARFSVLVALATIYEYELRGEGSEIQRSQFVMRTLGGMEFLAQTVPGSQLDRLYKAAAFSKEEREFVTRWTTGRMRLASPRQ